MTFIEDWILCQIKIIKAAICKLQSLVSPIDDIEYFVDPAQDGVSTYQNNDLKGKRVRVIRNHIPQGKLNDNGYYFAFDPVLGEITFTPNQMTNEHILIQVY